MGFFGEIDNKECRANARRVLGEFRMLARIADYNVDQIKSPLIDGLPKATSSDHDSQMIKTLEKLDRKHAAQLEIDEITKAILKLDTEECLSLYYTYLVPHKLKDFDIAERIYHNLLSVRTLQNRRDRALVGFCEIYRNGELLVFM